ncbi:MAG: ATP-binding protein, partial [Pedobacter sp.]
YAILTFVSDYRIKLQSSDDLIFDPHESEILVTLDNFAFTAMVQNIVDNAFKHNVSVNKKVKISISEAPNSFFLHINDNGNGMNKKLEKKIFDKFFRAQTDTSVPGLGLGLYYVKQCIDLHGWSIKLETEVGKGTEFIIRIPGISFQDRLEKGTKND